MSKTTCSILLLIPKKNLYQNTKNFLDLIKIEKTGTRAYTFLTRFTPCRVEQSLQDMYSQEKEENRRGKV